MDIVFLRDLRIDAVIGIYGWERRVRQTLVFDLEMSADVTRAAASDRIEDTLNYKAVAKRLIEYVGDSDFQLVETLAERCAAIIREEFDVRWVRLTLNKKGAVRGASDVGVIIERGERS
ncbi:MAG: dihydroneopterin aldolase [Gammaproteobacteria bacterium]|nr:dihydroneopterin aldolase [Gammaproteobacteria bacterium]